MHKDKKRVSTFGKVSHVLAQKTTEKLNEESIYRHWFPWNADVCCIHTLFWKHSKCVIDAWHSFYAGKQFKTFTDTQITNPVCFLLIKSQVLYIPLAIPGCSKSLPYGSHLKIWLWRTRSLTAKISRCSWFSFTLSICSIRRSRSDTKWQPVDCVFMTRWTLDWRTDFHLIRRSCIYGYITTWWQRSSLLVIFWRHLCFAASSQLLQHRTCSLLSIRMAIISWGKVIRRQWTFGTNGWLRWSCLKNFWTWIDTSNSSRAGTICWGLLTVTSNGTPAFVTTTLTHIMQKFHPSSFWRSSTLTQCWTCWVLINYITCMKILSHWCHLSQQQSSAQFSIVAQVAFPTAVSSPWLLLLTVPPWDGSDSLASLAPYPVHLSCVSLTCLQQTPCASGDYYGTFLSAPAVHLSSPVRGTPVELLMEGKTFCLLLHPSQEITPSRYLLLSW